MTTTSGKRRVEMRIKGVIDGGHVTITDEADEPVGNACEALHALLIRSIKGEVLERRAADSYHRRPPQDPHAHVLGKVPSVKSD